MAWARRTQVAEGIGNTELGGGKLVRILGVGAQVLALILV